MIQKKIPFKVNVFQIVVNDKNIKKEKEMDLLKVLLLCTISPVCFGSIVQPNVWFDMEKTTGGDIIYSKNGTINNGKKLTGSFIEYDPFLKSGVAYFSGNRSGIIVDDIQNTCLLKPDQCTSGYTVTFWIKWTLGIGQIFSSTAFNMKHFTESVIPIEVWDGSRSWNVFHDTSGLFSRSGNGGHSEWHFYTIKWNKTCLTVFVAGKLIDHFCATQSYSILISDPPVKNRLAIGTSALETQPIDGLGGFMDDVMIWDRLLSNEEINATFHAGLNKKPKAVGEIYSVRAASTKKEYRDSVLKGKVVTERFVSTVNDCYLLCQEHGLDCHSFNYQYNGNPGSNICQINSLSKEETHGGLSRKDGFIYYDII